MIIEGYKGFNGNKTNRQGDLFEEGKTYKINGNVSFGNNGNGFHMCTSLSDVFRYFDEDIVVAKVIGYGNTVCYNDEYYGYYNMYAVSNLYVTKFLTRDEIITKMLKASENDTLKFLSTFALRNAEKKLFLKKYENDEKMQRYILYYQYGYQNIFKNKEENYQEGIYVYLDKLVKINRNYAIKINGDDLIRVDFIIREFYEEIDKENDLKDIIRKLLNLKDRLWLIQPFDDGNKEILREFILRIINELGYIIDMSNYPLTFDDEARDIQYILNKIKKKN